MQITNRIHFDNLRGDIFGGLTAAVVSLPLALAFEVASGAGAIVASLTAKNPELGLPPYLTLSKVLLCNRFAGSSGIVMQIINLK